MSDTATTAAAAGAEVSKSDVQPPVPEGPRLPQELVEMRNKAAYIGSLAQQLGSWVQSAGNCLEINDLAAMNKHLEIAQGIAANIASISASAVDWPKTLTAMRNAGSRPPLAVMVADVDRQNGVVAGATWWGKMDAAAYGGKSRGTATPELCIVIPFSKKIEDEKPKLVIAG